MTPPDLAARVSALEARERARDERDAKRDALLEGLVDEFHWNGRRENLKPLLAALKEASLHPAAPTPGPSSEVIARVRREALEEAAKAVEAERVDVSHSDDVRSDWTYNLALEHAALAIRALATDATP